MAYKHGTYGEFAKSIGAVPVNSETTAVYVGVAPVNLVRGYADMDLVDAPVKIGSLNEAREKLGYSTDWKSFTLCEAIKAHFDNTLGNAGPVVFINVLDPATHKKSAPVTQEISFVSGRAYIVSDTIILDTLALGDKVEGTDYTVEYDYSTGRVVLNSKTITGAVNASFSEVDPSTIIASDIIGKATANGEFAGLGAVQLVYTELGLIPNIINAPGFSSDKAVYSAMVNAATKINGHWDAIVNADLDTETADTIAEAIEWKRDNEYVSERSKVYWPQWKSKAGDVYHLSTLATWLMLKLDAQRGGVPMDTPSNKQIPSGNLYFGETSRNRGFDQQMANTLNAKGITTATFWGGLNVLWGPHTAAYDYDAVTDNRVIFDNSIRTMMHITNSFQQEWGLTIDQPMTLALAETIKNREQDKADALYALGALIGEPVVAFNVADNGVNNLVQGDFTWESKVTPTPPFKSGTLKVAYTTEGFAAEFGGEE